MFLQLTTKLSDFITHYTLKTTSQIVLERQESTYRIRQFKAHTPATTTMLTKFPSQGGHSVSALHSSWKQKSRKTGLMASECLSVCGYQTIHESLERLLWHMILRISI